MELDDLFIASASKTVSPTDKSKGAYVLSSDQREVLEACGLVPIAGLPAPIVLIYVLGEQRDTVEASYYVSERADSGRAGEPRMGRAFISDWLDVDDVVTLATDGEGLFAYRANAVADPEVLSAVPSTALKKLSTARLRNLQPPADVPATQRITTRAEYLRSPVVVELVLRRARGQCEYPGCEAALFRTVLGEAYLEVHHIEWLAERGADTEYNAAALCPSCHRAQHHASDRAYRKTVLQQKVAELYAQ